MTAAPCGCSLRVECVRARYERLSAEDFDRRAAQRGNPFFRAEADRASAAYHWRRYAAHRQEAALRTPSRRRFLVLGGPGGYLTCLAAGDPELDDRYRSWTVLFQVRRPLTPQLARAARGAALRCFELVEEGRR